MLGMEKKLNVISNNLANMETTGFKKQRCNFEDLFYDNLKYPGSQDVNNEFAATGIAVGVGTRVTSIQTDFTQGSLKETERPLDVAIAGEGFFRVIDPNSGNIMYTRAGNMSINSNGAFVMGSGHTGRLVDPEVTVPPESIHIDIREDGTVWYKTQEEMPLQQAGQFQLTTFINPEGLLRLGENLFQETDSSGAPNDVNPMENGGGKIMQKMVEMSNVSPVNELIDMITSQRAYELNSKSTQTGDQLLQTVISIKR
jgi:flagellar basal-body rod protein FlgG